MIHRMIPLSMTLTPISRSQHFSSLNISETTRDRVIVTIERQYEVICALSHGDISNDHDGPLTRFSRSQHFWSWISQIPCVLRTEFLQNTNRKPHPVYWMYALSMTLSDLWSGFQGHNIFWSRILEKRHNLKTKLQLHNRKLYLTYGMVLCLVTLTDL